MDEKEIDGYLVEKDILRLVCEQVVKDFEGAGASKEAPVLEYGHGKNVRGSLLEAVKRVLRKESNLLSSLLYRVDISEKQIAAFSQKHPALSFEEQIAELILRRVLQKVILKKRFSNG